MLYVDRNVIWAIRRKNQSKLFRKTYASIEGQFLYFSKKYKFLNFSTTSMLTQGKWAYN